MFLNLVNYIIALLFGINYGLNNFKSPLLMVMFILIILGLIYNYKTKNIKLNYKHHIIIFFISVILVLFTYQNSVLGYSKKEVKVTNQSEETITINSIYIDGSKIKLGNNIDIVSEYSIYNKLTADYSLQLKSGETYKIKLDKNKKIEINFLKETFDYSIVVDDERLLIPKLANNVKIPDYFNQPSYTYSIINTKANKPLIFIFLSLVFYYLLTSTLTKSILANKKNIIKIIPVLALILFELNPLMIISTQAKIIIFALTILGTIFLKNKILNIKYLNKKNLLLIILISLYGSFAINGNIFLNSKFTIQILIFYLLFASLLFLIIISLLSLLDKIKLKNKLTKKLKTHRLLLFILITFCLLIYNYAFTPFILPSDGGIQLRQIEGLDPLDNWQPFLNTLIIKLFINIFNGAKYYIYFRIVLFALGLSSILIYLHKKGFKLRTIYLIGIGFSLLPNVGVYLNTLWKDVDFSLCLTWFTWLNYLIIKDYDYFKKNKLNYLTFILSLLGIAFFRSNGIIVATIIILILLIYFIIKKYYPLIITTLLVIIFSILIRGPLYKNMKVQDMPRNFSIATMLHGLDYLLINDELNNQDIKYLESIMPLSEWENKYDKYNIDLLIHHNKYDLRYKNIDKSKITQMYLKFWAIKPDKLLKDRLYGTSIIWNILSDDKVPVYRYHIDLNEVNYSYTNELQIKKTDNFLTKIITKILFFIANNKILDMLFFRSGIYIVMLMILLLHAYNHKIKNILIIMPLLVNIITLFIGMHHQSYRYVFNIFTIFWLLFLLVIVDINHNKKVQTSKNVV